MRLYITYYYLQTCGNIKEQRSVEDYQIIENDKTSTLSKEQMEAKYMVYSNEAERLMRETGYHWRDDELDESRKIL